MSHRFGGWVGAVVITCSLWATCAFAAEAEKEGFEVHDMKRPQPAVVTPPTPSTQEQAGKAPSDAIALFDGTDLSKWKSEKGETAPWKVVEGVMEIAPHTGAI